ncbi:uncharacterized protein [Oryza sativa Japonica Group]|uniref:uncharacterized protein isoform X2 n=1 Tax=Oryza sativa subsp. japonica TaxID=39947 RepID=UPI0007754AEC|nr:uncharacterized protein LOC9270101 isoform X2 [Oryza sativa Japonica Group]
MLRQCKFVLNFAWFNHLYKGKAEVPFLSEFGETEKLQQKLLLDFTREVSEFLGVLAVTEENYLQDPESMSSISLFRFILTGDCFDWLDMSLFGYFVDDEATSKAIPFLRSLIHLATTDDMSLRLFIVDDLLPSIVRRLDNQLTCAIQCQRHKLNPGAADSAGKDLVVLCQQLYNYFQIQEFSREGKDNCSAECSFSVWIEKLKKDLELKASSASKELPEGCEWNWEFEEEFQRYLHVYMDILQEVNAMDDCMERDYLDKETLFQKLKFEFRYKHAINSYQHPYMVTISSLRQRQFYTRTCFRCNMQICKFLSELVKLKPYIKVSDCSYDVIENLKQNHEILTEISDCEVVPSVDYYTAVEQIRLHKEFDNYLSSGELDHSMDEFISSKDEFVEDLIRDESTMAQFSDLNHALLKLSLERRADVLENQQQICIYSECLRHLLEDESLKDYIKRLMNDHKTEGFFDTNDDSINWDKKCFSDLVDEFNERVFSGHSLPKHYMIRGIIDCWLIFTRKGNSWQDTFEEVVVEACERWTENREKIL